jgi:hypothetical protein
MRSSALISVASPYLTTSEAAGYLRYRGPSAIRNLVYQGALKPVGRRGRTWFFLTSDLDAMIRSRGAPSSPEGAVHDYTEKDSVSGDRSHVRRSQAHPGARRGSKNWPDEGSEESQAGDSRRGVEAAARLEGGDRRRRSKGRGGTKVRRLRRIVDEIQGASWTRSRSRMCVGGKRIWRGRWRQRP